MFTPLLEKLVRHEDLTEGEAAAAMREVMEGRAAPVALAVLWAWATLSLARPPVPATTLGWTQVLAGLLVVAFTAAGHHFEL